MHHHPRRYSKLSAGSGYTGVTKIDARMQGNTAYLPLQYGIQVLLMPFIWIHEQAAFTARVRRRDATYSSGETYYISAADRPRLLLEACPRATPMPIAAAHPEPAAARQSSGSPSACSRCTRRAGSPASTTTRPAPVRPTPTGADGRDRPLCPRSASYRPVSPSAASSPS